MRTNRLFDTAEAIWSCPSCRRYKKEIGSKRVDGTVLFAVVRHHDHIRDYPPDYFRKRLGKDWARLLEERSPGAWAFIDRIQAFTISFSHTRICQPCNHMEHEAKIITKAPKYFSFPPQAMREFVTIGHATCLSLNRPALKATYSRLLPDYQMRFNVADQFVRNLERGMFWADYSIPRERLRDSAHN